MNKNVRDYRIIISRPGGVANKDIYRTYKISLPNIWVRDMGLSDDNRDVQMTYDDMDKTILIVPSVRI